MCPALHLLTVINHLSNATAAKIIRLDGSKSSRLLNDDSRVLNALSLGKPSLKKNKKKMTFVISGSTPPPPPPILKKDDKLFFIFFSSTRPYLGHFWKKISFAP